MINMIAKYIIFLCRLTALLVATVTVVAKPSLYQVEVIAFEQGLTESTLSKYLWPLDPGEPSWKEARFIVEPVEQQQYESLNLKKILPIEQSRYNLKTTHENFARDPNYKILFHYAWEQQIDQDAQKNYVRFQNNDSIYDAMSGRYVRSFDGIMQLKPIRHGFIVKVDGLLRKPAATNYSNSLQSYRLTRSAKIKHKQIHYLDHPLMGMLVYLLPLS